MGKIWRDLSQMLTRFLSLTDDNLEDKFINEQYKNRKVPAPCMHNEIPGHPLARPLDLTISGVVRR